MWHLPPDQMRLLEELEKGPDRSAAIVSAALVESAIGNLISDRLQISDTPAAGKARKDLLASDRPLGSVSARCKLAFLLGIISEDALNDLKIIAEVRNSFAHAPGNDSFEIQSIKDKCDNFRLIKQNNRIQEVAETVLLEGGLVLRAQSRSVITGAEAQLSPHFFEGQNAT